MRLCAAWASSSLSLLLVPMACSRHRACQVLGALGKRLIFSVALLCSPVLPVQAALRCRALNRGSISSEKCMLSSARATLPDHVHPLTLPSRASRRVLRLSRAYKGRPEISMIFWVAPKRKKRWGAGKLS